MKNILVVGAHYDDSELGVGGTMALLSAAGKKVWKLTLTDNETNFTQKNIFVDKESSLISSSNACKILGVKEINEFKPVKCNELFYSKEIMQQVEAIIFKYQIDTLFFHFDHDLNRDHVEASKICMIAGRHCDNLFMYQSNGYIPENQFHPTVFFDISKVLDLKKKSLACYKQEHNRFNKMFEMNIQRNFVWGYGCEREYVEGFVPVKMIVNADE